MAVEALHLGKAAFLYCVSGQMYANKDTEDWSLIYIDIMHVMIIILQILRMPRS